MNHLLSGSMLSLAIIATAALQVEGQVAQGSAGERQLIDGIAAIVGSEIILKSEVEMLFQLRIGEDRIDPTLMTEAEAEELRSSLLNGLIDQSLMVARALRDSIVVERNEVVESLDQWIAEVQANFGGESAFRQQLDREGISLAELRRRRRPMIRDQLLRAKLQQELGIGRPTAVSRRNAERFVLDHHEELMFVRHIVLEPPSDLNPLAVARNRIGDLREQIVSGQASFAFVAREFSDDPGSGQQGGDLLTSPRGTYVASVDSTIWSIPVGEISLPVESQFGWHIIEVISRDGEQAHARHILIQGAATGSAIRALADTLALIENALERGESFIDLVARFSDEEDAAEKTGYFGMLPLPLSASDPGLSPEWFAALENLEPGDWTGPLEQENSVHYIQRILWDISTVNLVLRNDFSRVELIVQNMRSQEGFREWLDELRRETYIEIKKD